MTGSYLDRARLDHRGIVVLGAGAGIGAACCRALADAGAALLCVDRDAPLAATIAAATGGHAFTADVTAEEGMSSVFAAADDLFADRLHGVVDVVGVANIAPIGAFDQARYKAQLDIVLTHALLAIQHAAPRIARNGGGAMTFIGSISGIFSVPGQAIYGMSKAALHHLVRCAAHEYGPSGVRMNVVAPSSTRTPRLIDKFGPDYWDRVAAQAPLRRAGEVEDVASAVLFLQSDLASYVTANQLVLDGGCSAVAPIAT